MIDSTKLCSLKPVWMTLTFIQGYSHMGKETVLRSFSRKYLHQIAWIQYAAMASWSVKAHVKFLFCMIDIKGRNFCLSDFINCTFKIWICSDAFRSISLKLGKIMDTTKLYILIPVKVTLTFSQGHSVRKQLLVQIFCCRVAWSSPDFCNGWLCKGDVC